MAREFECVRHAPGIGHPPGVQDPTVLQSAPWMLQLVEPVGNITGQVCSIKPVAASTIAMHLAQLSSYAMLGVATALPENRNELENPMIARAPTILNSFMFIPSW